MEIPTIEQILADFQRLTRKGSDPRHQAVMLVSRWIRCGHDIALLPLMVNGITKEIFTEGVADAAMVMKR